MSTLSRMMARPRSFAGAALAACAALLLAGCLLTPGKFTAALDLRKDGAFTYRYDGEIHLLALSKLAKMADADSSDETYEEQPCYDDDGNERPCTADEKAAARKEWDDGAAERKAKKEREAASMQAMLGGIDPSNPAAAEELAAKLRRQVGWQRVEYKGDGLFSVTFALSGRLGHDFLFPTIEGFPMANVFVSATRRQGGAVRIDAPGFSAQDAGNPWTAMMSGMMGAGGGVHDDAATPAADGNADAKADGNADETGGMREIKAPAAPALPQIEGTFTLTTNGEVLANNTDEGATATTAGKALTWVITPRTRQAPSALIKLDR